MFFHENEKCPVCDSFFAAEDDIVVCPVCGTPHHRACYNKLGHCANAAEHKKGFSYTAPEAQQDNPVESSAEADGGNENIPFNTKNKQNTNNTRAKAVCKKCGSEIEKSAPFCCYCGEKQDYPQYEQQTEFNPFFVGNITSSYEDDGETIDGKSVKDVSDTVRTNTSRFVDKFRKGKKISWNWGGFFFGAYYLFFRKMYKEGIFAMVVSLASSLVVNGLYVEQTAAFNNFLNMHYQEIMNGGSEELAEQMMTVMQPLMPAVMILMGVNIIISLVIALFADSMYKHKVMSVIDKVDKDIEEGEVLSQLGFMQNEMNLTPQQMRVFYLGKSGGTNFFAPLIAYSLLNLFMSFITKI